MLFNRKAFSHQVQINFAALQNTAAKFTADRRAIQHENKHF